MAAGNLRGLRCILGGRAGGFKFSKRGSLQKHCLLARLQWWAPGCRRHAPHRPLGTKLPALDSELSGARAQCSETGSPEGQRDLALRAALSTQLGSSPSRPHACL